MISLVSMLITYLIGMVLSGVLIKVIDVKGDECFRNWRGEADLAKIAAMVFLWPIIAVLFISLAVWAALWDFILPNKKYEDS
ncbi:hypothetical protein ES17_100 [Escherichia phage ES17]|uniref:Uncharacterized protein n=1 Tax=Escherichia phage ES17 TaxID=2662277 RepID=A0A7T0LW92_9CAUD|nr:hypothetical protein PQC45_gp100 [Escherichia phage ES17]QPL11145.1 hypothetical protein ES17_100 [Escherichia phage ES17]